MALSRGLKTIHFCWFGGNPLGPDEMRCIESWSKYLPDYEIRRWDESNFDVGCCDYVAEAYRAKKWAFVSDYARFDILYRLGGLYFDTDVEIIRPIDDLICKGPFMAFELDYLHGKDNMTAVGLELSVNPGLGLFATPGLGVYKDIIDSYLCDHFIMDDGSLNLETVVSRTTGILTDHGLEKRLGIQHVDGVAIYPAEYFNPKDFWTGEVFITDNTRAIHHFGKSWYSDADKWMFEVEQRLLKVFPRGKLAHRLAVTASSIKHCDFSAIMDFIKRQVR